MNNNKGKLARALDVATNLSIIALAVIATTVLIKNHLLRPKVPTVVEGAAVDRNSSRSAQNQRPDRPSPTAPAAGTQVSLPGVNWGESEETVLLALSNKCHFCSESAPFYQKLMGELAGRKDVRVVAVFPQEASEGKKYLEGLNVPITEVAQASLDSLGVRGTPTLLIVDKSGAVKQSWVGRLTADKESEVLSRVKS
jgi:thiol-disulfide isomerase/thioredoxin